MKKSIIALAFAALGSLPAPALAALLGPTPYLSAADSPFNAVSFTSFYLEDFQDAAINTSGLSATIGATITTGGAGSLSDSVEFTAVPGFTLPMGRTLFNGNGAAGLTFTFDAGALGGLPTHAGLVWTDGAGTISFEAFDQNGVSLGVLTGNHADNDVHGDTAEDRFYGAINASGISMLRISNTGGGIEVDHVQYGLASIAAQQSAAVPEPRVWALMIVGFALVGAALRRRVAGQIAAAH